MDEPAKRERYAEPKWDKIWQVRFDKLKEKIVRDAQCGWSITSGEAVEKIKPDIRRYARGNEALYRCLSGIMRQTWLESRPKLTMPHRGEGG